MIQDRRRQIRLPARVPKMVAPSKLDCELGIATGGRKCGQRLWEGADSLRGVASAAEESEARLQSSRLLHRRSKTTLSELEVGECAHCGSTKGTREPLGLHH